MSAGAIVVDAAREVMVTVADRLQETALEIIAGPGGALVLVLGVAGVAVLVHDAVRIAHRLVRGWLHRRRPPQTRELRARGLLSLGAAPAEIARAIGLPRDALTLVVPGAVAPRTNVPATAPSAAPAAKEVPPAPPAPATQNVAKETVTATVAAQHARARPLPMSPPRNANAPNFGEAA
jgi:hypothetical protein